MSFFGWFLLVRLTSSQMYPEVTWDTFVVCLKVFSKNSRGDEWLHLYVRFRFHADCIFRTALKTKTWSLQRQDQKNKSPRSHDKYWTCAHGVCKFDRCIGTEIKKTKQLFTFFDIQNVCTNGEDYSANSLGKVFQRATDHAMQIIMNKE